jgi:transcription antitermination factor NusB
MTASRNVSNPNPGSPQPKPHAVRKRTRARELVLRALYLIDVRGPDALPDVPAFFAAETSDPDVFAFAKQVFDGIIEHRDELDAKISGVAENWQIHRMAVIDRNLLRLGTFEFVHLADIPPKVSINEAIDLAKRYSTAESGAFVNGILDKLRTQIRPE